MSRLMLNLHEVAETGLYTSHRETCQFGTQSGILTHLTDGSNGHFTYRYNKQTTHHLQAWFSPDLSVSQTGDEANKSWADARFRELCTTAFRLVFGL